MNRILIALLLSLPVATFAAQFGPPGPPPDPDAQFEAASVKAADPASPFSRMMVMPGRLEATGVPVRLFLRQAFRVQEYQIVGAPDWVGSERFTIVAKAPDGAAQGNIQAMILNLLKDRFKLATHTETRDMPIFDLVIARGDGRLGPNLKPTSAECQAEMKTRTGGPGRSGPGGPGRGAPPPPPALEPGQPIPCGMMRVGPGISSASGQAVSQLAQMLAQFTGRPVIDKTGITGPHDFELKWAPEPGGSGPLGPPPPGAPVPVVDPDAPNIYTAIQEQLGLKLENARGPVDVIVIDRIERPALD